MKREMICISCPIGCHLTAEWEEGGEPRISGNKCPRGEEYGREEILAPKRVVTATVALEGGRIDRLPIKTDLPLPKQLIPSLLNRLAKMKIQAPVEAGRILIQDYERSGINVLATRSIGERF